MHEAQRQAAAASEYQAWEEMMEASVAGQPAQQSLAVLEIGCGERVPSVRQEMEDVVRDTLARGGRATRPSTNPYYRGHPEPSRPCVGCYYGGASGLYYDRTFMYMYLGMAYSCMGCGRRWRTRAVGLPPPVARTTPSSTLR